MTTGYPVTHTRVYPNGVSGLLHIESEPLGIEYAAALYESHQADYDYSEAFRVLHQDHARMGSKEDYAVWSTAGYADSAMRVAESLELETYERWEAQERL